MIDICFRLSPRKLARGIEVKVKHITDQRSSRKKLEESYKSIIESLQLLIVSINSFLGNSDQNEGCPMKMYFQQSIYFKFSKTNQDLTAKTEHLNECKSFVHTLVCGFGNPLNLPTTHH